MRKSQSPVTPKNVLALFDFDGTITTKDSFIDFIIYSEGFLKFIIGMTINLPQIIMYKLKIIPNDVAKESVLTYFFKGWENEEFLKLCRKYATSKISQMLRPEASKQLLWHKSQKHVIVIVSASFTNYLKPWTDLFKYELIASNLEVLDNKLTGKILNKNCYGSEKERLIKEKYNLSDFDYIYAYGDSKGDKEMLSLANQKYYKWIKQSD